MKKLWYSIALRWCIYFNYPDIIQRRYVYKLALISPYLSNGICVNLKFVHFAYYKGVWLHNENFKNIYQEFYIQNYHVAIHHKFHGKLDTTIVTGKQIGRAHV